MKTIFTDVQSNYISLADLQGLESMWTSSTSLALIWDLFYRPRSIIRRMKHFENDARTECLVLKFAIIF